MIFSFTMPIVTLREAEKADANRIDGGSWQDTDKVWFEDRGLFVDDRRVHYVLVLGSEDSDGVIPILREYIDPTDKQQAMETAQDYFNAWLAETMTATIKKGS